MKISLIEETFREEMNKLKSSGDFEDLLDLSRSGTSEIIIDEDFEDMLQSCGDLPGQMNIFEN